MRSLSSPSPSLEAGASRRPGAGEHRPPEAPRSSGSCERLGNLIRKASWHLISCTSALNGASLPNSPCLREARAAVMGEQGNEIRRVPARPKVRPGPGGRPRRGGVSAGGGRDGLRCYPSPPHPLATPNHPPLSLLPSNMPPTCFQHRPTRVKPALHQSQDSRASGTNAKTRVTAPRRAWAGLVGAPEQGGWMAGRVWWEGPARTGPAVCAGGQPAPSTPRGRIEMRGLEGGGTTESGRIRGDERTSQTSRGRGAGTALGSQPRDSAEAGTRGRRTAWTQGAGGRPSRAPESSSVLCLPF